MLFLEGGRHNYRCSRSSISTMVKLWGGRYTRPAVE
jgi:hypothetical protein